MTTTSLSGKDVRDLAQRRKGIDRVGGYGAGELAAREELAMLREALARIAAHEPGDWADLSADLAIVQAYARAALPAA